MQCPYCNHQSERYLETKDYNRRVSEKLFAYSKCTSCGLIFLENLPADLADYYPEDYHGAPEDLAQIARAAKFEHYKIDIVRGFKTSGRLLEIGPSYGTFSLLAKQGGFDVTAIEMDAGCCRFLESVVRVAAVCSADAAGALHQIGHDFDVIALWHSVEHIPRSWEVLEAAVGRLAPGGILLIAAPNPAALQFRVLGKYWTHVDAPRHLYLFPMEWLRNWATGLGLRMVFRTTSDEGARGWNSFGWKHSLANFGSNRVTRKVLKAMGAAIALPFKGFEHADGRGSAYTVVLEKS